MKPGHAGGGTPVGRVRRGALAIEHRADVSPEQIAEAIARHQANDRVGREACEKWGPGSSVSRVALAGGGVPRELAVKLHRYRGLRGVLSDGWRGSRAARARAGLARLTPIGVDSPAWVASAERRRAGCVLESWLVCEFRADAQPLPAALASRELPRAARRRLLAAVGDLVGRLHAAGVDHPDLKPSNLLVGEGGSLTLLDLDALVPPRRLTARRRVRALGQLEAFARDLLPWLSRTDRWRVLRAYLALHPSLGPRRAGLVREIDAWACRRIEEWSRRDRGERRTYPIAPRPTRDPRA